MWRPPISDGQQVVDLGKLTGDRGNGEMEMKYPHKPLTMETVVKQMKLAQIIALLDTVT